MREGRRRIEHEKQKKHRQHRYQQKQGHHHKTEPRSSGGSSIDSDIRRQTSPPVGFIPHSAHYGSPNSSTSSIGTVSSQPQVPIRSQYSSYTPSSHGDSPRIHSTTLNRVKPPPMVVSTTPPIPSTARLPNSPPMGNTTPSSGGSRSSGDMMEENKNIQVATQLFHNHDIRQKGRLTAEELRNLLQNDDSTHFCISAVDALINLFGATRFGTINQAEFVSLYKRVKYWRKVYVDNDINGSYTISVMEYHNSLQELGYLLPFEVSENIFDQYAEFISSTVNGKELKFDKFVESLVWLMRLTKCFRKYDMNQEGIATIHYKDFIDTVLYLGRFLPH